MNLSTVLFIANGLISTTYGWGEKYCGPPDTPVACTKGTITSTGEKFDPDIPTAAVAGPEKFILTKPLIIGLKIKNGPCQKIKINDRLNNRYFGGRGFDLSPSAVRLLTQKEPTSTWSDRIYLCNFKEQSRK